MINVSPQLKKMSPIFPNLIDPQKDNQHMPMFPIDKKAFFKASLYPDTIKGKKSLMVKISGDTDESLVEAFYNLTDLYTLFKSKEIEVPDEILISFQSPGGYITQGLEIVNFINYTNKFRTPKISFLADSDICSMGLYIFLCGKRRFSSSLASFMIHPLSSHISDNLPSLQQELKYLIEQQKNLDSMIIKKTNIKKKTLDDLSHNWYIYPHEAKTLGIIEDII